MLGDSPQVLTGTMTLFEGGESAYTVASFLYDSMSDSEGTTPRGSIYRDNVIKVGDYGKYEDHGKVEYTDKIIEHLSDRNCYSQGDLYDNVYSVCNQVTHC